MFSCISIISAIIHVLKVYPISCLMCTGFPMVEIGLQLTEYWYSKMWTLFYSVPCTIPSPYNKGTCSYPLVGTTYSLGWSKMKGTGFLPLGSGACNTHFTFHITHYTSYLYFLHTRLCIILVYTNIHLDTFHTFLQE